MHRVLEHWHGRPRAGPILWTCIGWEFGRGPTIEKSTYWGVCVCVCFFTLYMYDIYIYCTYIHKYQGSNTQSTHLEMPLIFFTKASQILAVLIYRIQIPRCTNGHEDWMEHNYCMLIDDISLWFNGSICRTCVFQGSITIINNLHLCFHGFIPPCVVGYENSPVSSVFYVQI